jgi:hypothetical protein
MSGMLMTSCIRGVGPFWRNSCAQQAVLSASWKQHGVQCREACVLGGALPHTIHGVLA